MRDRGGNINYPETQNMIPRSKPSTQSVDLQGGTPSGTGIAHAMWGYTYEIPSLVDTGDGDPGNADSGGLGYYWQMIIPVTTQIDRVTWRRTDLVDTNPGNIRIGLYDMNQSNDEFTVIAQTAGLDSADTVFADTDFIMDLDDRILILPGLYAVAYVAPCIHHTLCINENIPAESLINQIYAPDHLLRYGAFTVPKDGVNELPDTLDASNTLGYDDWFATYSGFTPVTYWDDSEFP